MLWARLALAAANAALTLAVFSGVIFIALRNDKSSQTEPAASLRLISDAPEDVTTKNRTVVDGKEFGDWSYACIPETDGTQKRCSITLQIWDVESKATVFIWRITQDGQGGLFSIWQTPTGLLVNRGLVLVAGTPKPIPIPFQSCSSGHCEAAATLASDFIETLSKTDHATAIVVTKSGQTLNFELSVKGLAGGLSALSP